MKYKDYYAALGVSRDANLDEIKRAYRKLARQHHPDMSKAPEAEARFKDAAEAYATLKDPEKRKAYDELGQHRAGEEFSPEQQWTNEHAFQGFGMDDLDLADLFSALGRGRHGTSRGAGPLRGRDFESSLAVSLEDAHHGTTAHLNLQDGTGERSLQVTIPAGVKDGQKLRLRGKGGKGAQGGADGDIYLHISLAAHPLFRVDGHNLYFDLTLAPWEAALGAEVEVPTLDRQVLLTVPALSHSGRKLRLRGRGLANRAGDRGDMYAVVHIDIPTTLSARERELYQELATASSFNPRGTQPKEQKHAAEQF
jgi:curved DNA-binding protein